MGKKDSVSLSSDSNSFTKTTYCTFNMLPLIWLAVSLASYKKAACICADSASIELSVEKKHLFICLEPYASTGADL